MFTPEVHGSGSRNSMNWGSYKYSKSAPTDGLSNTQFRTHVELRGRWEGGMCFHVRLCKLRRASCGARPWPGGGHGMFGYRQFMEFWVCRFKDIRGVPKEFGLGFRGIRYRG